MSNDKLNMRNGYIWNAIGSCSNAMSTMLLLLITTRIFGAFFGGIFTIAAALAQQMLTISSFETGTYYVTDGKNKINISSHFSAKLLLVLISVITATTVSFLQYDLYKAVCVIIVCIFKIFDGVSALLFAVLQKNNRIDIAGKSLTLRTVCVICATLLSQSIFRICGLTLRTGFMLSVIVMAGTSIIFIFTYELHFVKKYSKIVFSKNIKSIFTLLFDCAPMFLGSFILTYICNQPKFVIDKMFSEEVQNSFGIIFIPSSVICMLGFFIYKPLLVPMTEEYTRANYSKFIRILTKVTMLIAGITIICTVGAYIMGIPVFSFIYHVNLNDYRTSLCIGIIGGGMYAISMLFYNIISIMRNQRIMLLAYIIAFALSLLITQPLTVVFGINGAVFSYLLVNLALALLLGAIITANLIIKQKSLKT